MSEGQPPHLQFEDEPQALNQPLIPLYLQDSLIKTPLSEAQEEQLPTTAIIEARIAIAHMVEAGSQEDKEILVAIWIFASPLFAVGAILACSMNSPGVMALCLFLFVTSLKLNSLSSQNEQLRTALTLPNVNNSWIGPLTELLEWPGTRTPRIAMRLLSHLIPSWTQEDWESLTLDQKRILFTRLDPRYTEIEADLQIALLKGFEAIGNIDAIPYVERLEDIKVWNRTRRRVRDAATVCQRALEIWAEEEAAYLAQIAQSEEGKDATQTQSLVVEQVPPELEALIAELRKAREKNAQPGMRLPFLFASWCIIVPYASLQCLSTLTDVGGSKVDPLLWAILTVLGTQLHRLTLLPWQTASVKRLAEYDSVKGVGYLAEVLEWPDTSAQYAASSALIRLLPRLRASDTRLLNPQQRLCLYRKLSLANARRDYDLILATLKALEQVGDVSAVGYVQKLVQAQALTAAQRRIVQAAQECLPYLLKRAEANEGSEYLLRAAYGVDAAPETLLRPASEHDVPKEDLLRPSNAHHLEEE